MFFCLMYDFFFFFFFLMKFDITRLTSEMDPKSLYLGFISFRLIIYLYFCIVVKCRHEIKL